MSDTFLNTVDKEHLEGLLNATETNVAYFNDMAIKTAEKYTSSLDSIMTDLYAAVTTDSDVETTTLERYYLELTNLLYFMAQQVEQLNIYADMAKAQAKEVYNKSYLANCAVKDEKGKSVRTVAENTAMAEEDTKYEATLESIYHSAYAIAKNKVQAGYEMVNTLRKILTVRGLEMELGLQNTRGSMPPAGDVY